MIFIIINLKYTTVIIYMSYYLCLSIFCIFLYPELSRYNYNQYVIYIYKYSSEYQVTSSQDKILLLDGHT